MADLRRRLILANKRAKLHREVLRDNVAEARDAVTPKALTRRAKFHTATQLSAAAQQGEAVMREYRWPLVGIAVAGIAYALREPLARLAKPVARETRRWTSHAADELRARWDNARAPADETKSDEGTPK